MSVDWAAVAADPSESAAFHGLLDEYFQSRGTSAPTARPSARVLPPAASASAPPRTLPTAIPPPESLSSRANTLKAAAGPSIANAALKNTSVTNAAFRNAGLNPAAATAASSFSAKHSEVLAPHVANAASSGWANRGALASAGGAAPRAGIRKEFSAPSGLVTAKGGVSESCGLRLAHLARAKTTGATC